jgi:hypothetical protein
VGDVEVQWRYRLGDDGETKIHAPDEEWARRHAANFPGWPIWIESREITTTDWRRYEPE